MIDIKIMVTEIGLRRKRKRGYTVGNIYIYIYIDFSKHKI